jgi:hypothetical protein
MNPFWNSAILGGSLGIALGVLLIVAYCGWAEIVCFLTGHDARVSWWKLDEGGNRVRPIGWSCYRCKKQI